MTKVFETSGRRSTRSKLIWLLLVWIVANLIAWFGHDIRSYLRDWRVQRHRDFLASQYQMKSIDFDPGNGSRARLRYLLFQPSVTSGEPLPLVILLHGSGERGSSLREHLPFVDSFLVESEWQRRHPSFVVAPQCPRPMKWTSSLPYDMSQALISLIDSLAGEYSIDERRVYLVGYSMGGYGCWHLAARSPGRIAAMIPVAGGGNVNTAEALKGIPIWAIHGENDRVVPHEQSVVMVDAVNAVGGNARLTTLNNVGHDSWGDVKRARKTYFEWLFDQKRPIRYIASGG